jgi:C4-dicarboxylate transporter DctQ subunit
MWRWLEQLEEGLIAFLLATMTLITFAQVIARYVFNYSFVWAVELVSFLFAWLIFIGMAYGVRIGSHIGMDAVVKLLGPRAGRVVTIVATVLCIAYSVIIFVGSWRYVTVI